MKNRKKFQLAPPDEKQSGLPMFKQHEEEVVESLIEEPKQFKYQNNLNA